MFSQDSCWSRLIQKLVSDEEVQLSRWRLAQGRVLSVVALIAAWGALESGYCHGWHPRWAAYSFRAAPFLSTLAAAAFELYLRTASALPCPRYLHLAGLYCILTTLDAASVSVTFLGGCMRLEMVKVSSMLGLIVFQIGAFGIVQFMILLKVMTINTTGAIWPLRFAQYAAISLFCWSVIFVVRVAGWGVVFNTSSGPLENIVGFSFLVFFVAFTLSSASQMLRAAAKVNYDRVLVSHSVTTLAANSTSALRMIYILASQYSESNEVAKRYVFVHCVDIVFNLICALCVSGIVSALTTGKVDILADFRVTLLSVRQGWANAPAETVGSPIEVNPVQKPQALDFPTLLAPSATVEVFKVRELPTLEASPGYVKAFKVLDP